ncbi:MAG: TetR/AcrR family transcriptional regulator [Nitrospirae bacterium]|nr:TetR/AcrR family transcriptional regulator [Nitrospirota bacterium]
MALPLNGIGGERRADAAAAGRAGRTQAERTAASTQAILAAAIECFNRNGFQTTSMEEVAATAGVSKGLVLYHFSSKEKLLVEVVRQLYTRVSEEVLSAAAATGPSLGQAAWALDRLWSRMRASWPLMPLVLDLVAQSVTKKRIGKRVRPVYEQLRRMLIEGIGVVMGPRANRPKSADERLADLILAMVLGLWTSALIMGRPARAEQGFEDFKQWLLQWVGAGGVPKGTAPG